MWSKLMSSLSSAYQAGLYTWQNGPVTPELDQLQRDYFDRWAMYSGTLFEDIERTHPFANDPSIYANSKLLWKHVEAVVDFYAGVIYQGTLSTDGKPLPDGTDGAIPIDPQTGDETRNENIRRGFAELCSAWNWQQQMSLRPMYAASLADCLTELADDIPRGMVYPQIVWPGYVKEIELDYVGNVMAYTLEYRVSRKDDQGNLKTYVFRKEIDKDEFRYYRDDKPYNEYGDGAVVENPYGFVPAVWDRHRIAAPGQVRGKSAVDGTRQALLQLNSIFSHAFDYQRKGFFLPPIVSAPGGGKKKDVDLSVPPQPSKARELAESFQYVTVPEGANLLQFTIDIGKTAEMLERLQRGILSENPEASFYQQMREMQQVTAPGAERLMGDVKNRVDLARAGYDAGTVKLFQMAMSIAGHRANGPWWKVDANGRSKPLSRRQQAFLPFDLESYHRGEMDFGIKSRPLVTPTEQERIEIIMLRESLNTRWGLIEAGVQEDDANAILQAKADRFGLGLNAGSFGQDYAGGE